MPCAPESPGAARACLIASLAKRASHGGPHKAENGMSKNEVAALPRHCQVFNLAICPGPLPACRTPWAGDALSGSPASGVFAPAVALAQPCQHYGALFWMRNIFFRFFSIFFHVTNQLVTCARVVQDADLSTGKIYAKFRRAWHGKRVVLYNIFSRVGQFPRCFHLQEFFRRNLDDFQLTRFFRLTDPFLGVS